MRLRPKTGPDGALADLTSALVNLGFKQAIAADAAAKSIERLGASASLELLIKDALGQVGA